MQVMIQDVPVMTDKELETIQINLEGTHVVGFKAQLLSAVKSELETRNAEWFAETFDEEDEEDLFELFA